MENLKLGFIGAGNMGSALIKGIVASGLVNPRDISVNDFNKEKLHSLAKDTGVKPKENNIDVIAESDMVFLCVKPDIVKGVLEECKGVIGLNKVIVSIAVGIPLKVYMDIIGNDKKVIRVMPNTPALVGEGMTVLCANSNVTEEEYNQVKELFRSVGRVEDLPEKLMNEVTALTGSSPAYVFMFIEAMADAAVQSGIQRELAYKLAAQAVLGAAKMVIETGKHPAELKDQVCSPAGTTIEAVRALEKNGFRYAVIDAMNECTKKAIKIAESM